MKIKTIENFSNTEKAKPYTTVVDPVMDIAIKDDEKYRKDSEDIFDPYKRVKAKPFLGAEKQPVPKEPVEPKLNLKETYRSYGARLQDMIEDKLVEAFGVVCNLVYFLPENKLREFLEVKEVTPNKTKLKEGWEDIGEDPRPFASQIISMIENRMLDPEDIAISLIRWLPDSQIEKFMKVYELDDELNEEFLTERNWKNQLESGKQLRDAIDNDDYDAVIEGIRACYKEMLDKGIIDEDDFYNWTEQLDWIDLDDEDVEEAIDYELNELYDACDNLDCWVTL